MHAISSMSQKGGTSGGKAKENRAVCTLHTTLSMKERIQDGVWDTHHLVIALPILPAYSPLLAAAPVPPFYYLMRHLTWWYGVIWVIRNQWHWVAGGDVAVMWHAWAGLSLSSGGDDMALVGRLVIVIGGRWCGIGGKVYWHHWVVWHYWGLGDVVTWHWWRTGASTSSPWFGPILGSHQGAWQQQCWPYVVVVVVKNGIVTICDMGDISNAVARFGNLQVPINN